MNKIKFLMNFIKDKNIACLTPTSKAAVKVICRAIDFNKDVTVVEYGPGDGVFCRHLLTKMTPGSRLIAIETNDTLVQNLKNSISDNRFSVCLDSAENIAAVLGRHQLTATDYVISGIPFSFFDPAKKTRIVANTYNSLAGDGKFLVYQYSKHVMSYLEKQFADVSSSLIFRNMPPMQFMLASKS